MNGKYNGSGSERNESRDDENIIRFPPPPPVRNGKVKPLPFFNAGKIPAFTRIMLGAFVLVHLVLFLFMNAGIRLQMLYMFGFVPGYFTGAMDGLPWYAFLGPFTHMFLHGSWMHLAMNSVMGLAFGVFFERLHGARMTALFFFMCGLAGALTYFVISPFAAVPVIGASGAISGLFGAMILILNAHRPARHVWGMVGFWTVFMLATGLLSGGALAWQSHIGGFLAGAVLYRFRRTWITTGNPSRRS
ncbi:MAG: rhomboid family intramembrane serine protease [Alphaproteobacteria bacterium]|nr:rhomboid family intramembrane serine protease [Alphaproteobacteria bacterium]